MSSPTCRLSDANFSSGGPSQSVLQNLLEEIDRTDKMHGRPRADSLAYHRVGSLPYRIPASRAGSITHPLRQAPSLWVGGSSAAEDARKKLRALDEARQRRQTSVGLGHMSASVELHDQRISPQDCVETSTPFSTVPKSVSWGTFNDVHFGAAATTSTADEPFPTSESQGLMRKLQSLH
jgi:hypothetical protein